MKVTAQEWMDTLRLLAPPKFAADWDNVGLLVEGRADAEINKSLLCVDLTHSVVDEAITNKCDSVIAYHPPIFGGLKRLTRQVPNQNLIIRLIEAGIWVWSPHTALDAIKGGLCDWLLDVLGETRERAHLESCPADPENTEVGMGRVGRLARPSSLDELVNQVKKQLGLKNIRLATSQRHQEGAAIKRVAVCPGAGGSVLSKARFVDLLLTGEMRHHDVLGRVGNGTSVILTDHTNTERGFLPVFGQQIIDKIGIDILISKVDADPLKIV